MPEAKPQRAVGTGRILVKAGGKTKRVSKGQAGKRDRHIGQLRRRPYSAGQR